MLDSESTQGWLILVYKMPSNPSTLRIGIWKRMKELGALLLQQSVYVLPHRPRLKESVDEVKDRILKLGGQCRLLQTGPFDEDQQRQIVKEFRLLVDQDYEQIVDDCQLVMHEVQRKASAEKLTLAEFAQAESQLGKLKDRFDAAADRDFFVSPRQTEIRGLMKTVADFLSYSHRVLSRDEAAATQGQDAVSLETTGSDVKSVKEVIPVCSRDEMASRLNEVVEGLKGGTVRLGGHHVEISGEPVGVTVEYRRGGRRKSFRIGVDWR